jgi:predicted nucleic acid-binding Zn ribbon protein
MWSRSSSEDCPFCGAPVPPRKWVCAACKAEKRTRKGMSPAGFRIFFGLWAALAGALMLLAVWIAIVPWTPRGEPPDYALWVAGVRGPVVPSGGCKVEVIDANGRRQEVAMPGGCDAVSPAAVLRAPADAAKAEAPAIDTTTRRLAATVHSALSLLGGLLLCWLLQRLLRGFFLRRTPPSWVRRTA